LFFLHQRRAALSSSEDLLLSNSSPHAGDGERERENSYKPSTRDIFFEGKTEGAKGNWTTYDPESYPLQATKPNQTAI
jgi:hypothetical protein